MGLLDSLGGVLKGAMGEAEAAALPALVNAVLAKTEYHDLNGLVAALQQGGLGSRARRQAVDKAAAALLLQGALDAERSTGEPAGQLVAAAGGTQP